MPVTDEIAMTIAQKAPIAVKMAKKLINENQEIKGGLEKEIAFFAQCFATQDRLEGINAFLEKRKLQFKGICFLHVTNNCITLISHIIQQQKDKRT